MNIQRVEKHLHGYIFHTCTLIQNTIHTNSFRCLSIPFAFSLSLYPNNIATPLLYHISPLINRPLLSCFSRLIKIFFFFFFNFPYLIYWRYFCLTSENVIIEQTYAGFAILLLFFLLFWL